MYPQRRLRRLRRSEALRRLVAETTLSVDDLIAPLFVREGIDSPAPVASMPGVVQHSAASVHDEVEALIDLGIPAVMLFGIPARKDAVGSGASDPLGIVQVAINELRDHFGERIVVMADLCIDEYTDHGHCGLLRTDGTVDNDLTLERYAEIAVVQANAGVDVVAPSGMMDGQVAAIRAALDGAGHSEVAILAYAAKYATALYGPFRDAVDVTIVGAGDRRSYQQDVRNSRESLQELRADVAEGADMVMVKPAISCLDVIAAARAELDVPIAAYQVSGEFSMIAAAGANGWIDADAVALEQLVAIKRAGADAIVTYFARQAGGWLTR